MEVTKEVARQHLGKWVHCHSIYGMHRGVVYKAMKSGIILIHHTQLASGEQHQNNDFALGTFDPSENNEAFENVRLMMPYPGLYVPYAGMYGMWPGMGFIL